MPVENTNPQEPLKVVVSYCVRCKGHKNHMIKASEVEMDSATESATGVLFSTTFELLRCQGCDALSVRRDDFCNDPAVAYPGEGWGRDLDDSNGRHEYDYWPNVVKRSLPEWLWEIRETVLKETLIETYGALNANLPILAAAGTRTVFDLLADKLLGDDAGSFKQKLDRLFEAGDISGKQKETLYAVIDAGSAAQHRAHKVPQYDLELMFAILEGLLHQTLLADSKAEALRKRTPQRKK
jgi:hypothetical protein